MRSWAVPKGPSLDPAVKRFAVQVGDHDLAHNAFEGPLGSGGVVVWDRGLYEQGGRVAWPEALERGHAVFVLRGEKLRGGWVLQRTGGGAKPQWLLLKRRDEHARPGSDVVAEQPASVVSGRTLDELLGSSLGPRAFRRSASTTLVLQLPVDGRLQAGWRGARAPRPRRPAPAPARGGGGRRADGVPFPAADGAGPGRRRPHARGVHRHGPAARDVREPARHVQPPAARRERPGRPARPLLQAGTARAPGRADVGAHAEGRRDDRPGRLRGPVRHRRHAGGHDVGRGLRGLAGPALPHGRPAPDGGGAAELVHRPGHRGREPQGRRGAGRRHGLHRRRAARPARGGGRQEPGGRTGAARHRRLHRRA